jgi:quercetin dioxygenase-like cupin family protein
MADEILFHHGTTKVSRLRLAPGEAMPWHRDPLHRVPIVLRGVLLSIEYRDGGESQNVEVTPGQSEWESRLRVFIGR